ncbi:hypothetical protein ACSLNT_30260, partial [Escherichia coli]
HGVEHGTKRWRRTGHFQTDIKAFGHAQFCHHIIEVLFSDVNRPGCFAEYLVIPAFNAFKIPDNISDDLASIFDPFGNAVHT